MSKIQAGEDKFLGLNCYSALGMRNNLAVEVRYRLGSRNC